MKHKYYEDYYYTVIFEKRKKKTLKDIITDGIYYNI